MRIELEYRTRIYYWFDSTNEILYITVQIMQLAIKGSEFYFYNYQTLKINYNNSRVIYSASGQSTTNFNVYGYITSEPIVISEQPLLFLKPGAVVDYDINIEVILSQFLFYY